MSNLNDTKPPIFFGDKNKLAFEIHYFKDLNEFKKENSTNNHNGKIRAWLKYRLIWHDDSEPFETDLKHLINAADIFHSEVKRNYKKNTFPYFFNWTRYIEHNNNIDSNTAHANILDELKIEKQDNFTCFAKSKDISASFIPEQLDQLFLDISTNIFNELVIGESPSLF